MTMPPPTPPGWHPDPQGTDKLRWWDGTQWTSATRVQQFGGVNAPPPQGVLGPMVGPTTARTSPSKGGNRGCLVAVLVVVVVVVGLIVIGSVSGGDDDSDGASSPSTARTPTTTTQERADDDFVFDVCHTAVKNQLKDPDSAQFRNDRVVSTPTQMTWAVVGEVNARNSFGGRNGFVPYTCDATQTGDTVNAKATLLE